MHDVCALALSSIGERQIRMAMVLAVHKFKFRFAPNPTLAGAETSTVNAEGSPNRRHQVNLNPCAVKLFTTPEFHPTTTFYNPRIHPTTTFYNPEFHPTTSSYNPRIPSYHKFLQPQFKCTFLIPSQQCTNQNPSRCHRFSFAILAIPASQTKTKSIHQSIIAKHQAG